MRRIAFLVSALALVACATTTSGPARTLAPADSATRLIVGESVTLSTASRGGGEGQDALVTLTMRLADGRTLTFQEANHTPYDVRAQAAGGPLAQAMGIFDETARPTLYAAESAATAPFCAPTGPAYLGVYDGADGTTSIVGLKQGFQFEERADGTAEALPVSPDMVCSRMRFTRAG